MEEFFDKIKNRENFYLGEPINTESALLNNSIFSRKWYLYDVKSYNYFVETQGYDFDKYIHGNDDKDDCEQRCFLFTHVVHDKCGLGSIFAECLENYIDEFDTVVEPKYINKLKKYIKKHKLIREKSKIDGVTVTIVDEDLVTALTKKEWKCFLGYEYFEGQGFAYWIINTNKDSILYEHVVVCGSDDLFNLFHFSEMDNNMKEVYNVCEEYGLLK